MRPRSAFTSERYCSRICARIVDSIWFALPKSTALPNALASLGAQRSGR
jgi:hypothetical protein